MLDATQIVPGLTVTNLVVDFRGYEDEYLLVSKTQRFAPECGLWVVLE
jgi:hypothetical protein